MPPRNPELPEGTDHIINGAMETGAGTAASTGSSGGAGGSSSGFIASGDTGSSGDDTGGTIGGIGGGSAGGSSLGETGGSSGGTTGGLGGGSGGGFGGSGGGDFGGGASGGGSGDTGGSGGVAPVKQQLREGAQTLRDQAGDKVRQFAEDGKSRATTALDDFSQVVNEAASSIDERLGAEYGQYARRAAEAVSGFADTLRNKEVDELYDGAREVVRKSPGIAIGAAAVVGFALVRLIKSGLDDNNSGGTGGGSTGTGGSSGGRSAGTGGSSSGGSTGTGA